MNKTWGNYKVLVTGKNYKVKMLTLNPHSKTSLQLHHHRSEFWVFIDDENKFRYELVPVRKKHQLKNDRDKSMHILEVQFGEQCVEKDIERISI